MPKTLIQATVRVGVGWYDDDRPISAVLLVTPRERQTDGVEAVLQTCLQALAEVPLDPVVAFWVAERGDVADEDRAASGRSP